LVRLQHIDRRHFNALNQKVEGIISLYKYLEFSIAVMKKKHSILHICLCTISKWHKIKCVILILFVLCFFYHCGGTRAIWVLMSSHLIMFIRKFSSSSHLSSIEEGCTGSKYYIPQSYFSKLSKVLSIFLY